MNFDEIKHLLEIVREHELSEFELEREGFKIRIVKNGSAAASYPAVTVTPAAIPAPAPPASLAGTPPVDGEEAIELAVVKSPIVGTFYRSPDPAAPPFVSVGDAVKKDQVLCIIEAMKLMNEINSEIDGVITNIYVENGQPVQYGERLFAIRPL